MKILVAVKRVLDYSTRIRIKADQSGVETTNVKWTINPFDEIAVEEAVCLKEKGIAKEVVVVSIGNMQSQETIRTSLAMGADSGILIETDMEIQPLSAAKILKEIASRENPDLIILGKQAVDTDNNQAGQMLAGILNWPQGTFVSKELIEDGYIVVTREIDGGLETLKLKLPAVITTDLRLNEPRFLSLPNIMQAKRKTIKIIPLKELPIQTQPLLKTLKVTAPVKERKKVRVNTASELIDKLRHEARVLP